VRYPARTKPFVLLVLLGVSATGAIAGATRIQAPEPTTFSVTRLQAEEVASLVGFLRAYNRADMKAALSYFTPKPAPQNRRTATDCDYRRQKTEVYFDRRGLVQWLRKRFADHDRLTLARAADENPAQPIGVLGVWYARRTSDTLRSLGRPRGIVPQVGQKLVFTFSNGTARFSAFGLASIGTPTPNPECALVPAP
jgi:hypothetical protein